MGYVYDGFVRDSRGGGGVGPGTEGRRLTFSASVKESGSIRSRREGKGNHSICESESQLTKAIPPAY